MIEETTDHIKFDSYTTEDFISGSNMNLRQNVNRTNFCLLGVPFYELEGWNFNSWMYKYSSHGT